METMEKTLNKTNFELTVENFDNEINIFLDKIRKFTNFMDYRIDNDIILEDLKLNLSKLSLSQKKKLRNLLLKANYKMTLRSINIFLHYLYKNILKSNKRINIKISIEEEQIQIKRKEWIEIRDKSMVILNNYKTIKGDFYKKKDKKIEIAKFL